MKILKTILWVILALVSAGISIYWFRTMPLDQFLMRELIIHLDTVLEVIFILCALAFFGIKALFSKKRKDK